jgi:ligand-binding SRPBCC domain-containing protein
MTHSFESEVFINQPIKTVFDFFCKAENLDKITPKWLKFEIITKLPININEGTFIDYKIKFRGIPIKWKSEITQWNPPHSFQDIQRNGPYKTWEHLHIFKEDNGGTLVKDKVVYKSKGWFLEPIINKFFVKRDIQRIFDFRIQVLKDIFEGNHSN